MHAKACNILRKVPLCRATILARYDVSSRVYRELFKIHRAPSAYPTEAAQKHGNDNKFTL